jgi:hypothetical protein
VVTTKDRSFIAASINPVATICVIVPTTSHSQNDSDGQDTLSPATSMTMAKNRIENGKPNRKRTCVAPTVPSEAVSSRCIALRATWPSEARMTNGIQR